MSIWVACNRRWQKKFKHNISPKSANQTLAIRNRIYRSLSSFDESSVDPPVQDGVLFDVCRTFKNIYVFTNAKSYKNQRIHLSLFTEQKTIWTIIRLNHYCLQFLFSPPNNLSKTLCNVLFTDSPGSNQIVRPRAWQRSNCPLPGKEQNC